MSPVLLSLRRSCVTTKHLIAPDNGKYEMSFHTPSITICTPLTTHNVNKYCQKYLTACFSAARRVLLVNDEDADYQ